MFSALQPGDEVAVLPNPSASANDVIEIVRVRYVGEVYIELPDGRMFATIGGNGLNADGAIVPANPEHRAALAKRRAAG
jgi:hypothetical protein